MLVVPVPGRLLFLSGEGYGSLRGSGGLFFPHSPPRNLDSRAFITIGDRVGAGCSLGGLHEFSSDMGLS